jgi:hypothetical protein
MNTCRNCGGEEGLHEYETLRCPRNGQESPVGRPQLWQNTFWDDGKVEDDIETLKAEISLLRQAIDNLSKNYDVLEEKIWSSITEHEHSNHHREQ